MAGKKTKKAKKSESKLKSMFIVAPEPGYINIQLAYNELEALVTLLSASNEAYTLMAKRTADIGDLDTSDQLASRAQLCDVFAKHLNTHLDMEEPTSRHKH